MSQPVKGSLHQRARDMHGTPWCRECLTENMTLKCEDWLKNLYCANICQYMSQTVTGSLCQRARDARHPLA